MRICLPLLVLTLGCGSTTVPKEPSQNSKTKAISKSSQVNPSQTEERTASEATDSHSDETELSPTMNEVSSSELRTIPPNRKISSADSFVREPEWIPQLFQATPQVEAIRFELSNRYSNSKARCQIIVKNKNEQWSIQRSLPELRQIDVGSLSEFSNQHEVKLFGLKPDTRYEVSLEIQSTELGSNLSKSLSIKTQPVSDLFPRIQVKHIQKEKLEPGLTLFNLIRWENDKPDTDFGAIFAIDSAGDIRWSYIAPHLIFIVRQLANGNLLYGYGNRTDGLIEINLTGQVIRQWDAARLGRTVAAHALAVDVDSLHHDVYPTNSKTFLALATQLHEVDSYYDASYHPRKRIENASLVTDEVVEFAENGNILKRYSLHDLLDPQRIGYGSLHNFWDSRGYESIRRGTFDWSHSNSVTIDPQDDNIIVSVRHQDAVIKIDRQTGELIWILGTPKGWKGKHAEKVLKPSGGVSWSYHQHAAEVTPHGTLLMFDNGNYQAVPFNKQKHATDNYSRAVEYRIDEKQMKVEQVWEYAATTKDRFYSTFLCDVDWLPKTGNVLITNGGEIRDEKGLRTDFAPGDQQWAEIFEVTYGTNSEKVFDVLIDSPPERPEIGWSIYRAERVADLFHEK
ncbi:aryl-sulfate sulfotransferase [Planctomicrobium sp.]|jgi:arylsulfate sulfotransferase|nr:aryl-sulfate sulfotransferase [Planctomicrobium sp.]MBT5020161.1 hypothetical protein [Planctomicrobium sp.]MDA7503359.1 aryl-sulfate sulfotransferase [bacterium]MDB4743605.1 aryl-sulfate sulfotransferase [Planctomicrobium sp.]